jgi:PKD repeat protein
MNMNQHLLLPNLGRALLFIVLSASAGSALATFEIGTGVDNHCAGQPAQASAPQQSRPFRAAGFSCALCHTGTPTAANLNTFGNASASCTSTTCGAAVNPFCVATPPSNATITAPPAGTTVAQGQSLTYTAGNPTNPDGFPLSFTWLFSGGMANASGQSVSVPMTVAGSITATLQVRNSVNMLASGTPPTRSVTVTPPANQAPVATINAPAGNVTVAQGGTVNFQGSGTDPDNNLPLTFNWNFGGGAPNSTQQNPGAVTFSTAGTFTVTFRVTDSLGLASTPVTRVITVTPSANMAPTATINAPAGNVTVAQGGTVNFQGSGTDPDNNLPLSYSWNFGGGAPNSTQQNPGAVTFSTAGTFTVTFRVTDSLGLASTPVTRVITVTPPANMAPTAAVTAPAGNVSILQGGTVTFQGSGTDPDNNLPLTYSWNFGGGAPNSTQQNPGAVTFATAGTFTVTFRVADSLGLVSAPVTRTVTVTAAANQAPTATISAPAANVTIAQGGTVTFQGAGTDPDNNLPLTYSWNFGGGAPNSTQQNPGAVTFATTGTFTVTFRVADSLGLTSAPVTRTVTVTPTGPTPGAPVATILAPRENVTITQGGSVTFRGAGAVPQNQDAEDDDGNGNGERLTLTYHWDFGGGAPNSTRQNPGRVRFNTAGTFTVTFTVIDSLGRVSLPVTRIVTVTPPPVATIVAPAMNVSVLPGGTVTFNASATGDQLRYRWRFPSGKPDNSTLQNPGAVRFDRVGMFTITLTVTDRNGRTSTATRVITVARRNQVVRVDGKCVDDGRGNRDDDNDDDD